MDETVANLLTSTGALGVWLFDGAVVLASATKNASVRPPRFDVPDPHVFAEPISGATLVVLFDDSASLGIIRIRVRTARAELERALAARN